jgi:hypothetical protein
MSSAASGLQGNQGCEEDALAGPEVHSAVIGNDHPVKFHQHVALLEHLPEHR